MVYRGNVHLDTRPRRNLSTPEAREFWRRAQESAKEVEAWPEWKQAGLNIVSYRATPRTKDE